MKGLREYSCMSQNVEFQEKKQEKKFVRLQPKLENLKEDWL
jgi:hypothetical protein